LADNTVTPAGGGQRVNNLQPLLVLNFCIALQGIFPARD
jgi:microcystin-dependent protein